jgi:hypothetical protein
MGAQSLLWRESSLPRVRSCCAHGVLPGGDVTVRASGAGADRRAGFGGLATCGSVWACPVCAQKIAARRVEELIAAAAAWVALGGSLALLTLTMRHRKGQALGELWDSLGAAWHGATSGRAWESDHASHGAPITRRVVSGSRAGERVTETRVGFVRTVEATVGEAGWHLHVHALLFVSGESTPLSVRRLGRSMFGRWSAVLVARGLDAPTDRRGQSCELIPGSDSADVGRYLVKAAAWEVGGGAGKAARGTNRTPFQLLADVGSEGLADDLDLWHEWEAASHGRRQVGWSTGLRDFLELGDSASDDEIAAETLDGETLVTLSAAQYRQVRAVRWLLVEAACADDTGAALAAWLAARLGGAGYVGRAA